MPKMVICIYEDAIFSIKNALQLRDEWRKNKISKPIFYCTECRERVRAHKAGGVTEAHFEHLQRNSSCSQSHV